MRGSRSLAVWKSLVHVAPVTTLARPRRFNRYRAQKPLRAESLEARRLLAFDVWVNEPADWQVDVDQGAPGLDAGDTVSSTEGSGVSGLIFGTNAFSTFATAMSAVDVNGHVTALPLSTAEAVDISEDGVTLFLDGTVTLGSLTDTGTGTFLNLAGHTLTVGGDGASTSYDGVVFGSNLSVINKEGVGTWTLAGNSASLFGTTNVNAGAIRAQHVNAVGSGGVLSSTSVNVNDTAALEIDGVTVNRKINLNDGGTLRGLGTARSNGLLTIAPAAEVTLASTGTFTIGDQANDLTGGSGAQLHVTEGGTVVLNNASNLSDSAQWDVDGSTLKSAADARFGTAPGALTSDYFTLRNGGILDVSDAGALSATRGITLAGATGGTLLVNSTFASYGGSIVGSGLQLTVAGAGSFRLGANGVIADDIDLNVTGTLDLNGFSDTVDALSGGGTVNSALGGAALTVGAAGGNGNFSGSINNGAGSVSLSKQGAGTQTLSGTSNYSGATTVDAGTLLISGSTTSGATAINSGGTLRVDGTHASNVTVNASGTLSGTGTVTGDVNGGGMVAPGTSPGTLTINGNYTPSGTLEIELNSASLFDQLIVTGTVDLSVATLDIVRNYNPNVGEDYKILDKTSLGAIVGVFAGLASPDTGSTAEGGTIIVGDVYYSITYVGGVDSNDVILEVITPNVAWVNDTWEEVTDYDSNPGVVGPGDTVQSSTVLADNDLTVTNKIFGYNAFSTIQDGIDSVAAGGTVYVNVGTYAENVIVNKSVNLLGAQTTVDARTRSAPESRIVPATNDPDPFSVNAVTVVSITTDNVTIDGFTVDGDNTSLGGGVSYAGADINAAEGIASYTGVDGIDVRNNIVKNLSFAGITFDNFGDPTATSNNTITQNMITHLGGGGYGYGLGVLIQNNFYVDITNNEMADVRVGIQTGNFTQANPDSSANISGNEISAYRAGIWNNLSYNAASPFTISTNTVTAKSSSLTRFSGIWITSIATAGAAPIISGNTVTIGSISQPQSIGYEFWNDTAPGGITITGGSVTGGTYGVWVNNFDSYPTVSGSNGGSTSVTIDGLTISGSTFAGVYVKDNPSNTNGATVHATVLAGTSITGSAIGVLISGPDASASITGVNFDGATDIRIEANAGLVTIGPGNAFAGDTFFIDNQSTQDFDLTGANAQTYDESNNFRREDKMYHAMDDSAKGLIRWIADELFVTTPGGGSTDSSIQRAVDVSDDGDTIRVESGTYAENVNVHQEVAIDGAGIGSTIVSAAGNIFAISADNVTLQDLTVEGNDTATAGVYVNSTRSNIDLLNVRVEDAGTGLFLDALSDVAGLALTQVALVSGIYGLRVSSTGKVRGNGTIGTGMTVTSSHFDDNSEIGLIVEADLSIANNQDNFKDILITGTSGDRTTFDGNDTKGLYAEKLHNAKIEWIQVVGSGSNDDPPTPSGINLNFKKGTYSGIAIENAVLSGNGLGDVDSFPGQGLAIDADVTTYGPVSAAGISLTSVSITNSPIDLLIAGNVAPVTFSGVSLSGIGLGLAYAATVGGLDLADTAFSTNTGFIANFSPYVLDASNGATFAKSVGVVTFAAFNTSTGNPDNATDLDKYYAIEDYIIDRLDTTPYGLVRLHDTNLFVSNNGEEPVQFGAPLTPAGPSKIQNAVNVANVNETIDIESGTFNEVVEVLTQGVNLEGAGQALTKITYGGLANTYNGGVYLGADEVEIRDLTVEGLGSPGPNSPRYGIKTGLLAEDLVVEDVTVQNSFRTGLDIHGAIDITVARVTSQNNFGAGIFMTDVKGALLTDITTSGNPWTGVSIATSGQYAPQGTNGIVFAGTNSFGESAGANGGLQLEMFDFDGPSPVLISWSNLLADNADVTILPADFEYALSGVTTNPQYKYVRFYETLTQASNAAAATPDHLNAGTRYIQDADDSNDPLFVPKVTNLYLFDTVGDKMSIQHAIDAAVDGDIVHIGAGSFLGGLDATLDAGKGLTFTLGSSPGQVSIAGNLALDSNDTLEIELAGLSAATQFDNLVVGGSVSLGGADLDASRSFNPVPGNTFRIIDQTGGGTVSGSFAQGSSITIGGLPFNINYAGGTANDVVLELANPNQVWVNDTWVDVDDQSGSGPGEQPGDTVDSDTGAGDTSVTGKIFGYNAFATIQEALNAVAAGGSVFVIKGSYLEDITISKSLDLIGIQGYADTTVTGVKSNGNPNTITVASTGVLVQGLTVTREGNNTIEWTDPLNDQGISVQGISGGVVISENRFVGNRNGVYINNSQNIQVVNNLIEDNRTGIQVANNVSGLLVEENFIRNNWTLGILFNFDTLSLQTTGVDVHNNAIYGNWYGGVVRRWTNSTATLDVSGNWFGTNSPVVSTSNTSEPGYAALIPTTYGGGASNPGSAPDIVDVAPGTRIDFSPYLDVDPDGDLDTSAADADTSAAIGFQGDFSKLHVTAAGAQFGSTGRIQEGIDLIANGAATGVARTVLVHNGLYKESGTTVDKSLTLTGESEAGTIIAPAAVDSHDNTTFGGVAQQGILVTVSDVTVSNLTIDGDGNTGLSGQNNFRSGVLTPDNFVDLSNLTFTDLTVKNIYRRGILINWSGDNNEISDNDIQQTSGPFSPGGASIAVFGGTVPSTVATRITGNTLTHAEETGIVSNFGAKLDIKSNDISGTPVGMNLAALDSGSIVGGPNVSDGNIIDLDDLVSDDIGIQLTFVGGAVTVQNNQITAAGDDTGLYLFRTAAAPVSILDNTFTATGSTSTSITDGAAIFITDEETLSGESSTDNDGVYVVKGNTISGFHYGVNVYWNDDNGATDELTLTIGGLGLGENNEITGNGAAGSTGIRIVDTNGTTAGNAVVTIEGNNSSISGFDIGIDVNGGNATISTNLIYDNNTGIRFTGGGIGSVSNNDFNDTLDNDVDIRLDSSSGIVAINDGNQFAGEKYFIDNRDSQSFDFSTYTTVDYEGYDPSTDPLADDDNFRIEDFMYHAVDDGASGLIRWVADSLFVSEITTGENDETIQGAVGAADAGDTIYVEKGTYSENVNVTEEVTIQGATLLGTTTVTAAGGNILTIAANNVALNDLVIDGNNATAAGIFVNSAVANLAITDVTAQENNAGLYLGALADVTGLSLEQVSLVQGVYGLRVAPAAKVAGNGTIGTGMTVTSSHFDDNDLGWNIEADLSAANNALNFKDILVTGTGGDRTTFNDNAIKGLYAEKLHNAKIEWIEVDGSGTNDDPPTPAGINLNFKKGTYTGVAIENAILTDNGLGDLDLFPGQGLAIDADFGAYGPVSASGISLTDVSISGSPVDLYIAGAVAPVAFSGVALDGPGLGLAYLGAVGGLDLADTAFSTDTGFIMNFSPYVLDASNGATFEKTVGALQFGAFNTSTEDPSDPSDEAKYYVIADFIADTIDNSAAGLVRLHDTTQFVSNNSEEPAEFAPFIPGPSVIQNAIAASDSGDTVRIQDDTYFESNLSIGQPLSVIGQSRAGVVIAPADEDSHEDDSYAGASLQQGFVVSSSDVTITRLTIDGDANGSLTGSNNFRSGIITPDDGVDLSDLLFTDLTVQNIYRRGIQIAWAGNNNEISDSDIFQTTGPLSPGGAAIGVFGGLAPATVATRITDNTLANASETGIVSNFGALLDIKSNDISGTPTGMNLAALDDGSIIGGPLASDGNTIDLDDLVSADIGILLTFTGSSPNNPGEVTVQKNQITGAGDDAGIWLFKTGVDPVSILDNDFTATGSTSASTGQGAAIFITDDQLLLGESAAANDGNYIIRGNTITGFYSGVEVYWNDDGVTDELELTIGGPNPLDNNEITGAGTAGSAGIRIVDTNGSTPGNVDVSIEGNDSSISGFEVGIEVDGGYAEISENLIYDNATGILVTGGGSAIIDSNDFDGDSDPANDIDIDVDGGTAKVQDNIFAANDIGLLVHGGGIVDAGKIGGPNFTGLGTSTGGNDFSSFTTPATSTAGAIVNLNISGAYANPGRQGYTGPEYDVRAYNNLWDNATPSGIENVVYHDADDDQYGFIDYYGLGNLVVSFDPLPGPVDDSESIDENQSVTVYGTFDNTAQAHTVTIDWGDSSPDTVINLGAGDFDFGGVSHTYLDDAPSGTAFDPYNITVTVEEGATPANFVTDSSLDVTVNNVNPDIVSIVGDTIDENDVATVSFNISDPGTLDVFSATINWGEGSPDTITGLGLSNASGTVGGTSYVWTASTRLLAVSHQYLDDNPTSTASDLYTVNISVSDDDTGTDSDSASVTVNNVNPTVAITGIGSLTRPEGVPINLTSSANDVGTLDVLSYSWSVVKVGFGVFATGNLSTFSFTPDNNGTYNVSLTVTDDDLGVSLTDTVSYTVTDVPPTIVISGGSVINEGSLYTLTLGTITSPGVEEVTGYQINWGDGSFTGVVAISEGTWNGTVPHNFTHTYAEGDNPFTLRSITVTLYESVGGPFAEDYPQPSLNVNVQNVAPTATFLNGGAVSEGSTGFVQFLAPSDPSVGAGSDTASGFRYAYDYNNDGIWEVGGATYASSVAGTSQIVPASFFANGPSVRTIKGRIYDIDNGFTDYLTNITVNNVLPVVNAGADATVGLGELFSQIGSFTDPGADTWIATVDYDTFDVDGPSSPVPLPLSGHNFTLSHTYTSLGIHTVTVGVSDDGGTTWQYDTVDVNVVPTRFKVTSVVQTPSGFDIQFNRAPNLSVLNLYDGRDNSDLSTELPDLTVTGLLPANANVFGSLIWDAATNTARWVKTGGTLAADTYTLTLRSASNAWKDTLGDLLDGDDDDVAGGNYSEVFVVTSSSNPVVSLPDFARGPGQDVDVPATASGLPLKISNGAGVLGVSFELIYDPALLTINPGLSLPVPSGWSLDFNDSTPGQMSISVYGDTALSAGPQTLIDFSALVPTSALYRSSNLIRLENLIVNEGGITGVADDAVHKVAYFGDTTGSGANYEDDNPFIVYNPLDATRISQQVADKVFSPYAGFDAHDMTDPVIVGDVSGDTTVSSLDASMVAQEAQYTIGGGVIFNQLEIPDLPTPPLTAVGLAAGPDPTLQIPTLITGPRGTFVNVPVNVTDNFAGVEALQLVIYYDTTQLDLTVPNITTGALTSGWGMTRSVNEALGKITVGLFNDDAGGPGTGTVLNFNFFIRNDAPAGTTPLDIAQPPSNINEGGLTLTSIDGSFKLDDSGPQVTKVYVGSSAWNATFLNYLVSNSLGTTDGYEIPFGVQQTRPLPWSQLDKISIQFNEDVTASASSLELFGLNDTYSVSSYSYNAGTNTGTWTLTAPIDVDKILLHLKDETVEDIDGNDLDGDWTDNVSTGPSGDGSAGTDFDFQIHVLPGDITGNGIVDGGDYTIWADNYDPDGPIDDHFADITGDGLVDGGDYTIWADHYLQELPPGVPSAPALAPLPEDPETLYGLLSMGSSDLPELMWIETTAGNLTIPAVIPVESRRTAMESLFSDQAIDELTVIPSLDAVIEQGPLAAGATSEPSAHEAQVAVEPAANLPQDEFFANLGSRGYTGPKGTLAEVARAGWSHVATAVGNAVRSSLGAVRRDQSARPRLEGSLTETKVADELLERIAENHPRPIRKPKG